jgi:ABC-type uncharacterized transport system permease subunit
MAAQTQFLPSGNVLCPVGGCRVIDPSNFNGGVDGLVAIVITIAQYATFVIAALAVLFVIYGALLFLVGGEKGHEKGRKVIVNAVIAVTISILSYSGIQLLINILDGFKL